MVNGSSRNYCVTTVTDTGFLGGTLVLLASFLHHNPWFAGDIVIIHDGLPGAARGALERFPNVRFHEVGSDLKARLATLAEALPRMSGKLPILYSLDAFNLRGYDWVLKIDSDVLCTGSAAALPGIEGALLGAPDQSHFRDKVRHLKTYVPQHKALGSPDTVYPMTFNAGILLLRPPQLPPRVYTELIDRVHPDTWSMIRTGHTDSVVLNGYFRGAWTQVPEKYNYAISREAARYERRRTAIGDAVFLHYIGRPKPWEPEAAMAATDGERRVAYELWQEAWRAGRQSAIAGPQVTPR